MKSSEAIEIFLLMFGLVLLGIFHQASASAIVIIIGQLFILNNSFKDDAGYTHTVDEWEKRLRKIELVIQELETLRDLRDKVMPLVSYPEKNDLSSW
jgi:hypothetical protein